MKSLLSDPRIFNYIVLSLYGASTARWLCAGKYWDALYWFGAFIITSAVTFRS